MLAPPLKSLLQLQNSILFLFLFSLTTTTTTHSSLTPSSSSHTKFIYASCSQDKFQPNTPFHSNLNSFLSSIASSSSQLSYNSFSLSSPPSPIFGLYQCRGDLRLRDCAKCVSSLVTQLGVICPLAAGASLQLEGCYARYARDEDFLGKQDMGVRYRKCSKVWAGGDEEFLRRRDDVTAELEGAGAGGFRVTSSGLVEGYAQCLGDVREEECGECLVEAVGKLKRFCGEAVAADVFLGQCYARYWASGYYNQPDSSNEDQVGKSVAIIVGVLAGLAILIVLLSICRKSMG